MFIQKLTFKNSRNLTLSAVFEGEDRDAPVVVMCHGFGSSKEKSSKNLAQKLVQKGISALRFDFTGCGESEGSLDQLIPSTGLNDLESTINATKVKNFALYGSSFGGYVSLLYVSKRSVLALALKNPVSDWAPIISNEVGGKVRENILNDVKGIDIYEKVKNLNIPVLIIHGDKDDVVPIEQSKKLVKSLKGEKHLEIIKGADHDILGEDLERASNLIADFFQKHLHR